MFVLKKTSSKVLLPMYIDTFYGRFVLQTGVNDEFPGVKVGKSPSGNQIKLEMGCVLSSSGANTMETTDR